MPAPAMISRMAELDRRKSDERRSTKRYEVHIDIEWENHDGRRTGTLSDVSEKGCFVLTSVDVADGELVKVFIPLSDGVQVEFLGQIANYVAEIGFAVHFLSLTESQKEFLSSFVAVYSDESAGS